MIVYFDTSAIIPLIVDEPASPLCERFWADASEAVSSRLFYAEARAALARAHRLGRLSAAEHARSVPSLDALTAGIANVEVTEGLVRTAGQLASEHGLRGYDAVHLAAALTIADDDAVLVSGDRQLLAAATRVGLVVAPTG